MELREIDPSKTASTLASTPMIQAAATPSGTFDYEEWQKRLGETVSQTTEMPSAIPYETLKDIPGARTPIGEAAVADYYNQYKAIQQQAEQAGTGLEMASDATLASMQRLDEIRTQVGDQYRSAMEGWDLASEKADEYVQASRARVGETLAKLDEINEQIGKDRDFAKAHAMQATAQAVLGSMKTEERNILETYGAASKEYEQFRASKQTSLATAQSNIHANYQQLAEQQAITYLNVVNEAMWKQNMYTSFQEQQHVEMLRYLADAKAGYAMQHAQFQIGVEQLKMAGMENLANWVIQTPSFTMDSAPLLTLLGELGEPTGTQVPIGNRRDIMGARAGGSRGFTHGR